MAKQFKLYVPDENDSNEIRSIIWTKCFRCQNETSERLTVLSSRMEHTGYDSLAENLLKFDRIGSMPLHVNTKLLNEGCGICETLIHQKAKYHKSCCL